jgi:predicted DNA-binding protein (MmcQ/YjbR family)
MDAAELRTWCLHHPGAVEDFPFGPETSVFKVAGKIFAISRMDQKPLRISLKCEPALAEGLRAAHPEIIPGYHLNKRHWNTVPLDGSVPADALDEWIRDSYDLVVASLTRAERAALG